MALVLRNELVGNREQHALAGYGMEGRAVYDYLKDRPDVDITILDENPVDIPDHVDHQFGPTVFNNVLEYDVVWRTAGLNPKKLRTSGTMWSMTREFLAQCPAPIIGVTGSKGKGTTASVLHQILTHHGYTSHLLGNIGVPALSVLPTIKSEDVVVFELSSFQLWDVTESPTIAVILMIEPDHLDVHADMDEYVQAKSNIARWQSETDITISHPDNKFTAQAARPGIGRKLHYLDDQTGHERGGSLWYGETEIMPIANLPLPGTHNIENVAAAVTAAWQFGAQDPLQIAAGIKAFHGLPHRLQVVAEKNGIRYVDDSIATTPTAARAGITSFNGPKVIILGGSSKGADYDSLAQAVSDEAVVHALLIGDTAPDISAALQRVGYSAHTSLTTGDMETIIAKAETYLPDGGTILLSPGCASFGLFTNYVDRGEKFAVAAQAR
jgi:UDP-N-acetylmuramoylalanine--D-glutamate ligase